MTFCNRRTTEHSSWFHLEYRTRSCRRYGHEHTSGTIDRRWNNSKYVYITRYCKYSLNIDILYADLLCTSYCEQERAYSLKQRSEQNDAQA